MELPVDKAVGSGQTGVLDAGSSRKQLDCLVADTDPLAQREFGVPALIAVRDL